MLAFLFVKIIDLFEDRRVGGGKLVDNDKDNSILIVLSMERKLTAILSADVEGYSRLMGEDEEATIRTLTTYRSATERR